MKINRLSAAALLMLSGFAVQAAQPPATAASGSVDPAAQSPDQAKPDGDKPRPCLQTGSRLPSRDHCVNAAGQVVTREELDATGAMTMGDALRRTVPSATVR